MGLGCDFSLLGDGGQSAGWLGVWGQEGEGEGTMNFGVFVDGHSGGGVQRLLAVQTQMVKG